MRIIDKNTDFYDYLANVYIDNTITFDRRDSFKLTKEMFMERIPSNRYGYYVGKSHNSHLLLQVHHTFWLMRIIVDERNEYGRCIKYHFEYIDTWKNYNSEDKLIDLSIIEFNGFYNIIYKQNRDVTVKDKIDAINNKQYDIIHTFNEHIYYKDWVSYKSKEWNQSHNRIETKHIPILNQIGISDFVNPLDIYLALEEYFKNQIEANERRDPIGTTDNDKVAMHGFDDKSFRKEKKIVKKKKKLHKERKINYENCIRRR